MVDNDAKPALRVGMVGYGFMGAAHSLAWRTAGRVYDLPLRPVMVAICGRSEPSRLGVLNNRLEAVDRQGRHRSDRHLHSGRHPRRDRDRGAGGWEARAVRKAGL